VGIFPPYVFRWFFYKKSMENSMTENRLKLATLDYSLRESRSSIPLFVPWVICALGALYYCYEYFLRISPSVMTQELMQEYHLTATEVGVFSAYYYHAYVPMQILVGLLMDRFGPRKLLTTACLCCTIGTFLFASRYSLEVAEIGRFFVGFGSAFAFVGALKLATIWLPANRFALVSGIILCLGMLGAMSGDILLRTLVDFLGWQVTIYFSAITGIILTLCIWTVVRDVNPSIHTYNTSKLDFNGLLSGLWLAVKNPQIWINGLVGLLLFLSLTAVAELWGISYLEQARGLSKTHAANANSLIFLGWAIGGPLWGWFSDYIKRRCLPMLISSIVAFVIICILLYVPQLSIIQTYFLLFSFGLFSSVQILVFSVCHENTSIKITATAVALTNTFVMMGGNLFQPIIGKLLDLHWSGAMVDGVRVYSAEAYQFAFSVMPIGILMAIMLLFFLRETHAKIKL
jgi:sugar phosphate permease